MEHKRVSHGNILDYVIGGLMLDEYLDMIRGPLLKLIGLSVLSFLMGLLVYIPIVGGLFALIVYPVNVLIWVVSLVIAGYIGSKAVNKHSGDLLTSFIAGALAGLLSGIASGILSVLSKVMLLFLFPIEGVMVFILEVIDIILTMIVGLILTPIIWGLILGFVAIIGGVLIGGTSFESMHKR